MFASAVQRSVQRSKRAPSNWTFNTKYPSSGGSGGGQRKPRVSAKQFRTGGGLALPATRRLARLDSGVGVRGGVRAPKKPAASGSSSSNANARNNNNNNNSNNNNNASIAARLAAQRKYDAKFAMAPLDTKPATLAQLAKAIEAASFQNMGLFPDAVAAIRATLGERAKPTPVQALAIPASLAMGGKHGQRALLVGAETGGGKTLAYLLPLITRLKTAETVAQEAVPSVDDTVDAVVSSSESNSVFVSASKLRRLRRPRAIILVPSRDLVAQVTEVAKSLCSHHVRLTVLGIHARQAHPERLAAKLASTPIDILVTTPHELKKHLSQNTLALSKLTEVVVDESDTLFDDSNSDDLQEIQHAIRSHIPTASVTTVDEAHDSISNEAAPKESPPLLPLTTYISATFPVSMTSKIAAMHPEGYTQIATPRLHRPLPGLKQMFLSVTSSSTKQNLLLDVLKRSSQSGEKRVIIFVNSRDTGTWLCDFLRGKKVVAPGAGAVFLANGEMEGKMRDAVLGLYKEGKKNVISKSEQTLLEAAAVFGTSSSIDTQGTDGEKLPWSERLVILVATDVASRGVDTTAADHIILYDFPRSSIEYLHRVGRTARNGGKGRATSLLTNRDRRVADEIELAVRRGNVLC